MRQFIALITIFFTLLPTSILGQFGNGEHNIYMMDTANLEDWTVIKSSSGVTWIGEDNANWYFESSQDDTIIMERYIAMSDIANLHMTYLFFKDQVPNNIRIDVYLEAIKITENSPSPSGVAIVVNFIQNNTIPFDSSLIRIEISSTGLPNTSGQFQMYLEHFVIYSPDINLNNSEVLNNTEDFKIYTHNNTLYASSETYENTELSVYTISGKKVWLESNTVGIGSNTFDLNHLVKGIYFVVISNDNKRITKKIVIN